MRQPDKLSSWQFVRRLLLQLKDSYPNVYKQHISGRLKEFIAESAPKPTRYDGFGERVGYLGKDLQLLCAVRTLLEELAESVEEQVHPDETVPITDNRTGLLITTAYTLREAGLSCVLVLWIFVRRQFNKAGVPNDHESLCICSDWSIRRVARTDLSSSAFDEVDALLWMIEGQLMYSGCVGTYARALPKDP